jgi:hypothetical protein
MELAELKSTWKVIETPIKTAEEIKQMLLENKHPVLKKIRLQFTLEIIGWSVFLLVYHSMLDGDKKPLSLNIILVSSVLISLVHNLIGYKFTKFVVNGITIKDSLKNYLSRLKSYAIVSILSRVFLMIGALLFFTSAIRFDTSKYLSLLAIVLIFILQLFLLFRVWTRRIKKLRITLGSLVDQ